MVKLFRVRARLFPVVATIGAMIATSLPAVAQAPAQCAEPKGKANWTQPGSVTLARSVLDSARTATDFSAVSAQVDGAKSACNEVKDSKLNGPAQMCIADATFLLARQRSDDRLFQEAVCAYAAAVTLAKDDKDASNRARRADAWDGRARTYAEWSKARGMSQAHLQSARDAYLEAVKVQTPARLLGLARVQKSLGQLSEADMTYTRLSDLEPGPGYPVADKAAALREQARLRRDDLKRSPAEVRPIWEKAIAVGATSEAYFELGKSLFDADPDAAARAFRSATTAPSDQATVSAYPQESFYLLSVIEARKAKTAAEWKIVFEDAQKAGLGDVRYRRLACLAHVASGDPTLAEVGENALCADGASAGAEDKLLRGVYLLRRAQFMPFSCPDQKTQRDPCNARWNQSWVPTLTSAESAFEQGQEITQRAGSSSPRVFDWLLLGENSSPGLFGVLKSGENIAESVKQRGACTVRQPTNKLEQDFFGQLDLLTCQPTRRGK
jgi:hypothetical protein